jgi:3-dehydroquinate dehydratase type I
MRKPVICASIAARDAAEALLMADIASVQGADLLELRLDLMGSTREVRSVVENVTLPSILTLRKREEGGSFVGKEENRIELLLEMADEGFDYVDVELSTPSLSNTVKRLKELGVKVVISHHDLNATPSLKEMRRLLEAEISSKADVCKLVTTARDIEDNLRCLRLVREFGEKVNVVCFAMGKLGVLSRIFSPLFGAAFTYASIVKRRPTAPGQLTVSDLKKIYEVMGLA